MTVKELKAILEKCKDEKDVEIFFWKHNRDLYKKMRIKGAWADNDGNLVVFMDDWQNENAK